MDALNGLVLAWAGSPLVLIAVLVLVLVDGFFPPVPSESVVVALAAIGFATGAPSPWAVLLAAGLGSFLGDNLAFALGRRIPLDRWRWLRGPRASRLLARTRTSLERRSASVILTARFVPVGRVLVNMLAGANGLPRRRFLKLSAVSGLAWAAYSVLIGVVAGSWLHDQPLLGAIAAMALAFGFGLGVDALARALSRRRERARATTPSSDAVAGATARPVRGRVGGRERVLSTQAAQSSSAPRILPVGIVDRGGRL